MSPLKRFAFYFGGFAIGLILLYFFIGGSGASCEYDYGPNSRTLKNMEEKGLIVRKPNPLDGRGVLIHLTPFGIEMREFSKKVVIGFDEAVYRAVDSEDLKTFKKVTNTILELINSKKIYIQD